VVRRRFALVGILALVLAAWPAAAGASTTVDTTSTGNSFDIYFGATYETVGETITPPPSAYNLESLSFFVNLPATVSFKAQLYQWDPLQNAPCCFPPVWQSDPVHTSGSVAQGSYTEAAFETGGILLDPAKTYIVLISTYGLNPPTVGFAEARDTDAYPGGSGWTNSGAPDAGSWTALSYADPVTGLREADLGFKATFSARPVCFGSDESDPDGFTHPETPVTVALDCRDAGSSSNVSISTAPAHGTTGAVTQANGSDPATVQYTPANGFNDDFDTFEFQASNADGTSAPATAVVHVGNLAPACTSGEVETEVNTPVTFTPTCTDPEDDALTFSATSGPLHGTAVDNGDGSVTYAPAQDFIGHDDFTGVASDGDLLSNEATVGIDVFDIDHPPVCAPVSATVDQNKSVTVEVSCSDPDGDPIARYQIVTAPTEGLVAPFRRPLAGQPPTPTTVYTERSPTATQDTFTYAASAGGLDSAPARVTITINPAAASTAAPAAVTTPTPAAPGPRCHVPKLVGRTLKAAKKMLRKAHCALGRVTRKPAGRKKRGRVLKQRIKPGATRAAGTRVGVTIGG
jgi:hypothetical protein